MSSEQLEAERRAFEAWVMTDEFFDVEHVNRHEKGHYADAEANMAWHAWEAACLFISSKMCDDEKADSALLRLECVDYTLDHSGYMDRKRDADLVRNLLKKSQSARSQPAVDDLLPRFKTALRALFRERVTYFEDLETMIDVAKALESMQPAAPRVVSDEVRAATAYLHTLVTSSHNPGWAKNREYWATILDALEYLFHAQPAVPNNDTGTAMAAKHGLFIYRVEFDDGQGLYVRLNDFNAVCEKLDTQPAQPSVPVDHENDDRGNCNVCGSPVAYGDRHRQCGNAVIEAENRGRESARASFPLKALKDFVENAKGPFHVVDDESRGYQRGYRSAAERIGKLIAAHDGKGE